MELGWRCHLYYHTIFAELALANRAPPPTPLKDETAGLFLLSNSQLQRLSDRFMRLKHTWFKAAQVSPVHPVNYSLPLISTTIVGPSSLDSKHRFKGKSLI